MKTAGLDHEAPPTGAQDAPRFARGHIQCYRVRIDHCIDGWRDVDGGHGITTKNQIAVTESFQRLPDPPGRRLHGPLATPVDGRGIFRGPGEATRVQTVGLSYILAGPS